MYITGGQFVQNILGTDGRLCQNNLAMYEDLYLYEYGRLLLHKQLVREGMLSQYANPFYLPTEVEIGTMEKDMERKKNIVPINKETITIKLQVKENNIILKEDITSNEEEE